MFFCEKHLRERRGLAAIALTALLSALGPLPLTPAAEAAPGDELARAQEHYDFAEFEQALGILDGMIAAGRLAGDGLRDAQVLRARCLVGLGRDAEAQTAYCSALRIDRQWRPDEDIFPKVERDAFERALADCPLAPEPAAVTPPAAVAPPAGQIPPTKAPVAKESKPWYTQPFAIIAGGVLLIGGVLGLAGGGGGDGGTAPQPLPDFPDPPTGK